MYILYILFGFTVSFAHLLLLIFYLEVNFKGDRYWV